VFVKLTGIEVAKLKREKEKEETANEKLGCVLEHP
jgi:hypothetical protein